MLWQALAAGSGQGADENAGNGSLIGRLLQQKLDHSIRELIPILALQQEEQEDRGLREEALEEWMPGYLYQTQTGQVAVRQAAVEDSPGGEKSELTLEQLMQLENQSQHGDSEETEVVVLQLENLLTENGWTEPEEDTLPSLQEAESSVVQENSAVQEDSIASSFIPHSRQQILDLTALQDYETLREQFYTVDSVTNIGRDLLDVQKLTERDLTISKEDPGPQILIYHTHSQEGFADSVPGDDSTTIMGVGEHLAQILEEQYGYRVLHHTGTYDVEERDSAYSRSLPAITQLLEEYPQIQVIIDLHRDAVADESNRLVMDLDGRPTARFMFFNGISWTRKTGSISYLQNDNLADNLAFSFQMKLMAEEYYPGLTRKNYINGYRYNMHLRPRTLLIELGAQNNTLKEAMNACDPIAHLLDLVLSGEEQ